ncbi:MULTISPECIES: class I adenylate-forming enzyme family protein [unclassified Streptomyces]|uniref:class I adenylate-forming enzyme family protein n=1 Tax=unclassified Streptomyces TaxID=2593676 RepID=UPI002E280553|nr:class I adenylate-forming enzyme family protein [Streptomyces sp. NBC_00223]
MSTTVVAGITLGDLLRDRVRAQPDRIALCSDTGAQLGFSDWWERSQRVAGALLAKGVHAGDRVALVFGTRDWLDYAVAYCGTLLAGAVAVPVSDGQPAEAVAYVLDHSGASAVLLGRHARVSGGGRWALPLAELEAGRGVDELPCVRPEDLAQVLYTSGTTGRPKGVAATHANLTYGLRTGLKHRPLAHSAHFLHTFPVGTNAGQNMLLNAVYAHPAALVAGRFTPGRFARLIEQRQVGSVFLVPAMAAELLNSGAHTRHDLSCVRLLGSTAAALPPALAARLAAAFPRATLVNYYTSTEAAPAQTAMVYDPRRPDALGRAVRGAVRVAGPDGRALPAGEVGLVLLRTPGAQRSYYRDRQAGLGVFAPGWVRMGDVGYLDEEGYLHLVDRESDIIKSGAFKVSTLQVEAALLEHADVLEAAVVGLPHPVLGRSVAAAVVTRSALDPAALRRFLADRLAAHEIPSRLVALDALPRNEVGKPLKNRVRELLERAPA